MNRKKNFKQIQKPCMPFLRFKKDEVLTAGFQALDLSLPFGEMEVLKENSELVKQQLGLERLEILSITDLDAVTSAGSQASFLNQNPPSPGNTIFIEWSKGGFKVRVSRRFQACCLAVEACNLDV